MSEIQAKKKSKSSSKSARAPAEGVETERRSKKSKKSPTEVEKVEEDKMEVVEEDDRKEAEDSTEKKEDGQEGEGGDEEDEVPAISHKERRLAKRRKLAGLEPVPTPTPSSSTAPKSKTATTGEGGFTIGNTPAKTAHGIWVGNMSFKTTSKNLLDWFEGRGLKEIMRINMPGGKKPAEMNRGFAYIDFATPTDQEIAVGLSEQHLDGRKLLIKSSSDFTGRPAPTASAILPSELNKTARKILDKQKNAAGPTLFMGNLGFETTVDEIREMFDAHQKAAAAWTKKEKADGEEGEKKEAGSDDDAESGSDDEESHKEEEESDRDDDSDDHSNDSDPEEGGEEKVAKKKPKKEKGEKGELKDLSKALVAGIRKVRLGTFEDTGKCKGWAFVDFHLPEQCTRALLNIRNHTLNGRSLVVEYASSEAVRRGQVGTRAGIAAGASRGGRGGGGRGGGRSGGGEPMGDRDDATRKRARDWDDGNDDSGASAETRKPYAAPAGRGGRGAARGGARGGRVGPQMAASVGRAKPGAALATAQRASEAIVESTGRKITF